MGGSETGGFNQQIPVTAFVDRKQIVGLQTLREEVVHHVFSGQIQFHRTAIGIFRLPEFLFQFLKSFSQPGVGIGYILHDMGSKPHFADSLVFHLRKNLK